MYVPPSASWTTKWDYYSAVFRDLTTETNLYFTNDYEPIDSSYSIKGDNLSSDPDSNGIVSILTSDVIYYFIIINIK